MLSADGGHQSSASSYPLQAQQGSTVTASRNLTIQATGSGATDAQGYATDGDLTLHGAQVQAGQDASLFAARDINLLSSQDSSTQTSHDHSNSASLGVGFALGGEQNGFTIEAAAAAAKGKVNGDSTINHLTEVGAGHTLTVASGRDTTLNGAQASADTVQMDVGRNLTLTSTQDSNHYNEQDQSESAGLSLCIPPICYGSSSASASYSQSSIKNNAQSVTDQTGIAAGAGGYQIHVGDTTALTGAALASTADPSQNLLDTGNLSVASLHNMADDSASQMGVSLSTSGSATSNLVSNGAGAALSLAVPQGGDHSSDTVSAIAPGTLVVRNNPDQDLSGIDRDAATLDGNGVSNHFDPNTIKENQALGQAADYVGMTAAGDVGQMMTKSYEQAAQQGLQDQQQLNSGLLGSSGRQATEADLAQQQATMEANQGIYNTWSTGGIGEVVLHAGVGALSAGLGGGNALQGALGAGAGEASMPYLMQQVGPQGAVLASTLVGAAVGGGAGASTANAGAIYNDTHHYSAYQAELSTCQKSPSSSGCGTILSMYGDKSVPLAVADANNPSGVVANVNSQTGQVVSYTITNAQNQPVLIMQPSDYQNYLATIDSNGGSVYQFIGNNSPEYSLQGSNAVTDLVKGQGSQAWGNLVGLFTNGSYWRDMGIGMAAAVGTSLPSSVTVSNTTTGFNIVFPAIANASADSEAGLSTSLLATNNIHTPYGFAVQADTHEALAALQQAGSGALVYRAGTFGVQNTADAQFWSFQNPMTNPDYALNMGMPGGGAPMFNWVMAGRIQSGVNVITRPAPGLGVNTGGLMELVTPPNSVNIFWFNMLPRSSP